MVQLFVDAAVLFGIVKLLLGDDAPEFVHIVLVSFGLAMVGFFFVVGMYTQGIDPVWALIPIAIVGGIVLMYFTDLAAREALIALALYMTYKVGVIVVFARLEDKAEAALAIGAGFA